MSRSASSIAKGIAIVMMLCHHLFHSAQEIQLHSCGQAVSYWPMTEEQVICIALSFKICVAVFVFITAYGTHRQVVHGCERDGDSGWLTKYSLSHLIKLYVNYWVIFAVALIIGFVTGLRNPLVVYSGENKVSRFIYFVFDLLGLAHAMGTPTFNATWWYMSFAVLFVLVLPAMVKVSLKTGSLPLLTASIMIPGLIGLDMSRGLLRYMPVAMIGFLASERRFFERMGRGSWLYGALSAIALAVVLVSRQTAGCWFWLFDAIAALMVCMLACCLETLPNAALRVLGKHSSNIFMLHTFIFAYYLPEMTYSFGNWLLILLFLIAASLICSCVLERVKSGFRRVFVSWQR